MPGPDNSIDKVNMLNQALTNPVSHEPHWLGDSFSQIERISKNRVDVAIVEFPEKGMKEVARLPWKIKNER